jgi:hypothetical protein
MTVSIETVSIEEAPVAIETPSGNVKRTHAKMSSKPDMSNVHSADVHCTDVPSTEVPTASMTAAAAAVTTAGIRLGRGDRQHCCKHRDQRDFAKHD